MKRTAAKLLTAVLAFLLLAGCAQTQEPYVPTGNALEMEDGSTVAPQNATEPPEQTLTMVYYPDRSMNPLHSTDFTNRTVFSLLYQGLFSVDRNYQAEPVLCSSYSVSEDMTQYTFRVSGARFSDGAAVTDEDVLQSLLTAWESTYYEGRFLHVLEIRREEAGGVSVFLDTPYENLPILLDIPIVKASQVDAEHPLGTGPYTLTAGPGGARLQKQRNWWCQAELVTTAEGILVIAAESAAQIRDEFEFGDVDLVCTNPAADTYADYRCDYELWDCENGTFVYLGCNMDSPVFSDEQVRAALTYAIDRDTLVNSFYRGFGRSATLPASPRSPYYSPTLAERYAYDGPRFVQALDAAHKRESGIILLVNKDDSLRLRMAREVARMLTDCGLKVELKALGTHAYQEALTYRTYDLYLGQTRLSANMDLSAFFHPYGMLSNGGMDDAGIYAMCLESLANSGNYYKLHQMIADDGRLCPLLFCGYAVYGTRGVLTDLEPARDNVFYYSLGKTLEQIRRDA